MVTTKELKAKQGFDVLEVQIVDKGDVRQFQRMGEPGRVCNVTGKDSAGSVSITLWNEQIEQVNVGDKIKLLDGYTSEWQGSLQVSTGKRGRLEKLK